MDMQYVNFLYNVLNMSLETSTRRVWHQVYKMHRVLKNASVIIHHPKKVLGHLWLPLLRLLLWWFSSEALSISHRVLINEVSFVGKSMSRIMNFNDLQWV